jgi:diguanylate cyclase (GGDEF)-like protein
LDIKSNIILNIYSILLLIIIYIHAVKQNEEVFLQSKIYLIMLKLTALMLVVDIFSRFDGRPDTFYPIFNDIGNLLIFILNPVVPALWLIYVHCQAYHTDEMPKWLSKAIFFIISANGIAMILLQPLGWFYFIDSENIYHRGQLFWIPAALTIVLLFNSFALILFNRERIEKKYYFSLLFFSVPPLICIILQLLFYGISLVLNGLTLSLLIVFFTVQNRSMDTDFLTGVYNRKSLQAYMKKKINASTQNSTFSAILIDLNNFKAINDTYGHHMGDVALGTVVKILKNCLRSDDFIARYGGDEFCIVLDISDKYELEETTFRINRCLEEHNGNTTEPFSLGFSMGYAVYDYQAHMKAGDFQKQIDLLMYENKRSIKNA